MSRLRFSTLNEIRLDHFSRSAASNNRVSTLQNLTYLHMSIIPEHLTGHWFAWAPRHQKQANLLIRLSLQSTFHGLPLDGKRTNKCESLKKKKTKTHQPPKKLTRKEVASLRLSTFHVWARFLGGFPQTRIVPNELHGVLLPEAFLHYGRCRANQRQQGVIRNMLKTFLKP